MTPIVSYGLFLLVLATKTGKYIYMHSYNHNIIILVTVKVYFVKEALLRKFLGAAG